jgi:DNA-binding CsgD family transcriptional regulator
LLLVRKNLKSPDKPARKLGGDPKKDKKHKDQDDKK